MSARLEELRALLRRAEKYGVLRDDGVTAVNVLPVFLDIAEAADRVYELTDPVVCGTSPALRALRAALDRLNTEDGA